MNDHLSVSVIPRRTVARLVLAAAIFMLGSQTTLALEVRMTEVRVSGSRVAAIVELRDLFRERFLELVRDGRTIFLQVQAELWEDRRIADHLALTTPSRTYQVVQDATRTLAVTDEYGTRFTHADIEAPLPVRLDLGPASALDDDRSYYLRAQVTAATVADDDIDQLGIAIFGDEQSAAGLASLGRFVFKTLLRIGKYLESASAELTTDRYTGLQLRSGVN